MQRLDDHVLRARDAALDRDRPDRLRQREHDAARDRDLAPGARHPGDEHAPEELEPQRPLPADPRPVARAVGVAQRPRRQLALDREGAVAADLRPGHHLAVPRRHDRHAPADGLAVGRAVEGDAALALQDVDQRGLALRARELRGSDRLPAAHVVRCDRRLPDGEVGDRLAGYGGEHVRTGLGQRVGVARLRPGRDLGLHRACSGTGGSASARRTGSRGRRAWCAPTYACPQGDGRAPAGCRPPSRGRSQIRSQCSADLFLPPVSG